MVTEDRLDRIENKVDKLVEGMVELIRFEEKMLHCKEGMERLGFRQDDLEERVEAIEKDMPILKLLARSIWRIIMGVITLVVAAVIGLVIV